MPLTDIKTAMFSTPMALASFVAGGGVRASVLSGENVFPMELEGTTLVVKISIDGGSTYPTTRTHTFGAGSGTDHSGEEDPGPDQEGFFMSIDEVMEDILADDAFFDDDFVVSLYATSQILIKTTTTGNRALKIDATSTGIGVDLLQFLSGQVGNGAVTEITAILYDNNGQYVLFFV